jgi:hypothetical protein
MMNAIAMILTTRTLNTIVIMHLKECRFAIGIIAGTKQEIGVCAMNTMYVTTGIGSEQFKKQQDYKAYIFPSRWTENCC